MRIIISLLLSLIMFSSCEFDDADQIYDLGNDFIIDPTRVIMVDTLTVNTFNTRIDTFHTSRVNRFLLGMTKNNYGIETYCESYFRIAPDPLADIEETSRFDSIQLILHLDGYHTGDTTQIGEFEVYRLVEDILVDPVTEYLYNNQQFKVEEVPLGRFTLNLNRVITDIDVPTDSVAVSIDPALGQELFDMLVAEKDSILENEIFDKYFKGICIRPVKGKSSFVFGINAKPDTLSSPKLRLYYSDKRYLYDDFVDFPIENEYRNTKGVLSTTYPNYNAFVHITNNYQGSLIESLSSSEDILSSNSTNNVSFIQAGMLRTRIEIPYIDDFYYLGTGTIVSAELFMEPDENNSLEKADLPSQLGMSLVDHKNRYFSPLYVVGSTQKGAIGVLNYNDEFKMKTYYSYDITSFVKDEYDSNAIPKYALMLHLPYDYKYPNVDQLVIGNQASDVNELRLKVYITNY
ncbi:MAG: hypothetical protein JXR22_09355 [Prolixibacteraceae bacterium]|nr:hypothetical protein [Prolixibacteraceae bacterium]